MPIAIVTKGRAEPGIPVLFYPIKSRGERTMGFFLLVCWMLSLTGFTMPGRVGPLSLQALDPLAMVKLVSRLCSLLILGPILLRSIQTMRSPLMWHRLFPLALFGSWAVVSVCWSALPAVTLGHAIDIVLLVVLSATARVLCVEDEDCRRVFFHLTLIAILVSLLLIILNFQSIASGQRPIGYMQPNDMAKTAGAGLLLFTCCRLLWRWKWTTGLFVPAVAILAFLVFAARSRTASILTPAMLLVICWPFRKFQTLLFVCIVSGLVAAAVPYSSLIEHLPDSVRAYVMRGQTTQDFTGLSGRAEMWSIALQSFKEAPLFGHGYYSMSETGFFKVWRKVRWQTAHNAFLHALTGLGLFGLVFLLWGLFSAIRPSLIALRDLGRTCKPEFLALTILIWYCAMGMFELSFFGPVDTAVVIFFVLLGVSAGRPEIHRPRYARLWPHSQFPVATELR